MGPEFRSGSYKVTARPVSTKGRNCQTDDRSIPGHPYRGQSLKWVSLPDSQNNLHSRSEAGTLHIALPEEVRWQM
jgi:hypothetical protein